MDDHEKTREQLIEEIEDLRKRLDRSGDGKGDEKNDDPGVRKNLAFLRKVIDTISNPIFVKDTKGRYVFCNTAFEGYTGLQKDEIIGNTDYDMNPESIADPYHDMDIMLLENGQAREYEVYFQNPDGNNRAILFNKACYTSADGSVIGLVGVITDVTDRKVVEEEKKELIARLSQALAEINTLSGLLPICSYCGNVRDDRGYWSKIEKYMHEHSGTQFSHGICPDCMQKHYPEQYEKYREKNSNET